MLPVVPRGAVRDVIAGRQPVCVGRVPARQQVSDERQPGARALPAAAGGDQWEGCILLN